MFYRATVTQSLTSLKFFQNNFSGFECYECTSKYSMFFFRADKITFDSLNIKNINLNSYRTTTGDLSDEVYYP